MDIRLKKDIDEEFTTISVKKGITIEEVYLQYKEELPFEVTAAKVNHKVVELSAMLDRPCELEFLDMRSQVGNLVYQNSIALVYLKAINELFGDADAEIANPLNKGLYTEIKKPDGVMSGDIEAIERKMKEIVAEDLPIEKVRMKKHRDIKNNVLRFYEIDGYKNFFYGKLVPSTGYLDKFQLRPYRRGVVLTFPNQSNPGQLPPPTDEPNMYAAFGEMAKWQRLLGINFVEDLNNKIRRRQMKEVIQLSEALHEKKIVEIAGKILKEKKRIILIAGPSSSGKTTFARRLCVQLRVVGLKPLYLGTDDYFLERENTPLDERGEKNFEDIEALDLNLFNDHMNRLLAGEEVDIPTFNFLTGHKEYGRRKTSIGKTQPIVIEGIHALNEKLTSHIPQSSKYKIYISPLTQLNIDRHNRIPTTDARLLRRITRDYQYRGKSAEGTIKQWPSVRRGEEKNIFPFSKEADVFFNSAHIYEISVLKKYVEPLLMTVGSHCPEYSEAQRLLDFLSFFETFDGNDVILNNSILREFIGGSVFID